MAVHRFDGEALRRNRRRHSLTQARLAEAAECSRNIVNRAEVESRCSDRMVKRFAEVLGIPPEDLYRESVLRQGAELTPKERRVVEIMRSGEEAQQAIWNLALGVEAVARRA